MKRWEYLVLKFSHSNEKILCAATIIGFLFTCCLCISAKDYSDRIQGGLSDKIMRLHVLANSDLDFDQELKLKVRDEILNKTNKYLSKLKTKTETREFLMTNLEKIKKIAQNEISKSGFDYDVKALVCNDDFPTKTCGDLILPAGNYETLKIIIGKGEGHNWWCVMFPPLCFIDATKKQFQKAQNKI